jgi:hypothetical protein
MQDSSSNLGGFNMSFRTVIYLFLLILVLVPISSGCSRENPVAPDSVSDNSLPLVSEAGQSGAASDRSLLGMWQMEFDVKSMTAKVEPIRSADFHLNVRPFIKTPDIFIRSWNPTTETLDLDVEIKNTSIYNGYDLRLIIFRDTIGHKLLNPNNYTHLWDIPEGTYSNGFIAYAKDNANRILHAGEWKTERLQILCPGGNFSIKFAIDASWPANCEEPYMMNNFTQGMLQAYQGATSDITVDVYDWQDNVDSVRIQCSAITGQTDTYMTKISGTKWGVELVNNNAVPEGDYFALIAATSSGSIDPLIHIVNVTVSPAVGNGFALTWGGTGEDYGNGIAVDDAGNIFVVGSFSSTVDFNPDPVEEDFHTSVSGFTNAFLSKFDSHGDHIWTQTWGAAGGDTEAYAVEIDSLGYVYVGGQSKNYLPGCILMKYDQDGNLLWQGSWGDGNNDYIQSVAIDDFDNIFLGGWYEGSTDFDPDPIQTDIKSGFGWSDAFVTKFDSACDYQWSGTWGDTGADNVRDIAVDSHGNVYCSGHFYKTVDLDPGTGTDIHSAVGGTWEDAFLSKISADGVFQWGHSWGGYYQDRSTGCAVDENDDVYVVGFFYYTVDFDPDPIDVFERTAVGLDDVFTIKFDENGDFKYVHTWGSADNEKGFAITCSGNGKYYVAGETDGDSIDFDPSEGVNILSLLNNFCSCFSLDGSYHWTSGWRYSVIKDLESQPSNNLFAIGYYDNNKIDFDPGPDVWNPTNYQYSWDVYINKLLPNGLWE